MNTDLTYDDVSEPYISVESLMELDFGLTSVPPLPEEMKIWDISKVQKTWIDEDWDELIPKDGFIYDFVLANRGFASPTAYWLWGGIMSVSTMLGRDAWLGWGDGQLFANFYTLLVGPPGTVKKSTVINRCLDVTQDYIDKIPNEAVAFQKRTPSILGKTSEASLYMVMENQKQTVLNDLGDSVTVESDGKVFACINELATFLSKATYSSGIVEKLTDMYDCKKRDSEVTRSRGMNQLKNIYATFFGGVTPDGLRDSIPESAFGGGFMSRVLTVYCHEPTRIFPIPIKMVGTPTKDDLATRLAWLSVHARGEYTLAPNTLEYYSKWYFNWFKDRIDNPDDMSLSNRQDIITLKLATLLTAQRYNHEYGMENVIPLKDYKLAERIVQKTLDSGSKALGNIMQSTFFQNVEKIKKAIINYQNKNGGDGIERAKLLQRMSSKRINAKTVNECLQQLLSEDQLVITSKTGVNKTEITSTVSDLYMVRGGISA